MRRPARGWNRHGVDWRTGCVPVEPRPLAAFGNRIARALRRLAPVAVAVAESHALVADHARNEILARAARQLFVHPATHRSTDGRCLPRRCGDRAAVRRRCSLAGRPARAGGGLFGAVATAALRAGLAGSGLISTGGCAGDAVGGGCATRSVGHRDPSYRDAACGDGRRRRRSSRRAQVVAAWHPAETPTSRLHRRWFRQEAAQPARRARVCQATKRDQCHDRRRAATSSMAIPRRRGCAAITGG